eukprot:302408-Rhodomonas_salina.2
MSALKSLSILSLCQNRISVLPEWIGTFTDLQTFVLAFNSISELPMSLGELNKLKIFNVFSNALDKLPISLAKCVCIEQLNLGRNCWKENRGDPPSMQVALPRALIDGVKSGKLKANTDEVMQFLRSAIPSISNDRMSFPSLPKRSISFTAPGLAFHLLLPTPTKSLAARLESSSVVPPGAPESESERERACVEQRALRVLRGRGGGASSARGAGGQGSIQHTVLRIRCVMSGTDGGSLLPGSDGEGCQSQEHLLPQSVPCSLCQQAGTGPRQRGSDALVTCLSPS